MVTQLTRFVGLLVLCPLLTSPAGAQDAGRVNPTDFLPLEVDNQWTYVHYYSNEAYVTYRPDVYGIWAEPGSPVRAVVQALFGLPGYPYYHDEKDDDWWARYDFDQIKAYESPPPRELTLEITHTEIIEGHEYFVFGTVPYDWPPVPNFFLAGQKVRFSDEGTLLIRWNEQDIPFYAFRAEEPYRTPAYPALHNENLLFELFIVPSRFLAKELENALFPPHTADIEPPPSLRQATAAGFWLWEEYPELERKFLQFGTIVFVRSYGLAAYRRSEVATGDLAHLFPAFENTILPISAVIGGQQLEFSYNPVEGTNVQPTTWGQLKARHGQRP